MTQAEFEKTLSKMQSRRRMFEGIFAIASAVLCIICLCLRDATKEVIVHEGSLPFLNWEEVNYNKIYLPFAIVGVYGAVLAGAFLLVDFLFCRFATVQKDLHYITVCRGMFRSTVYVDGVEKGRTGSYTHVVEVWLASHIRVTISFGRTLWCLAHISFSDNTASIEV